MAKAKMGDKVQVHYTGTLGNGSVFDSSGGSGFVVYSPMELVLGQGELLPRCEKALVGLEPGQSTKVKVPCREAYGPRDETLVFVAPRQGVDRKEELLEDWRYPNGKRILPFNPRRGDQMEIALMDGNTLPVVVAEVNEATITLDANHPLAGEDLNFEIRLVKIL
jgi:peptidylprolyl isomerase